MSSDNINSAIAVGALWMLLMRFAVKGIGFVSTIILARLLLPEDFGIVALAMSMYAFIDLIRQFGFGTVLIQRQDATVDHYNTAWSLGLILSSIAALALYLLSDSISRFYDDPRLSPVLAVLSLLFLTGAFSNIGVIQFQKEMNFRKEFIFNFSIKLLSFCITMSLAFTLRSYWALIYGMLGSSFVGLVLSYFMNSFRPRFGLKEYKEILGFSSWLFLNNMLSFSNQHAQNFLLGKYGGSSALGMFSVSQEISTITTAEIVAPVNRAAFPGYAKLANDKEKLTATYLKVLGTIAMMAIPSAIGLVAIAPTLIPVVLGNKWIGAIELVQLIAIASAFTAINTNSSYIYLALSKQKINAVINTCRLLILIPLLLLLLPDRKAIGAAEAILCVSCITFPLNQAILKRYIPITWRHFFEILHRPLLASLLMFCSVTFYLGYGADGVLPLPSVYSLVSALMLGGFSYFVFLFLIWLLSGKPDGVEKNVFSYLASAIHGI